MSPEDELPPLPTERDPGLFDIDNFLTEEEEAKILREIEPAVDQQTTS